MIRVLRLEGDGVREGGPELATPGAPIWVDCSPEPQNLEWLATRFGFHPLALEDCAHAGQRSKYEDYPGTVFVVLHRLDVPADETEPVDQELHAFLTAGALVTVHSGPVAELDAVFARVRNDPVVLRRGADFALYLLFDAITDAHFKLADRLSDDVEVLHEQVLEDGHERETVARITGLRHRLAQFRRRVAPQREVLAALARPGQQVVHDRNVVYFRDVEDHVVRITEALDVDRDLVSQSLEIQLAAVNNRLSLVMTRMALVATIFLPLSFVTSFFGMNLPGIDRGWDWWIVGVTMLAVPPGMYLLFKRRGWF